MCGSRHRLECQAVSSLQECFPQIQPAMIHKPILSQENLERNSLVLWMDLCRQSE